MKVVGLDGRTYQWKLSGKTTLLNDTKNRSSGHLRARSLLCLLFACDIKLEEVRLPGSGGLTADFVIPALQLVIEVHGRQHYEFVALFHETRRGFLKALERDRNKRQWCERNDFTYCELPDSETDRQWQARIEAAQEPGASD